MKDRKPIISKAGRLLIAKAISLFVKNSKCKQTILQIESRAYSIDHLIFMAANFDSMLSNDAASFNSSPAGSVGTVEVDGSALS